MTQDAETFRRLMLKSFAEAYREFGLQKYKGKDPALDAMTERILSEAKKAEPK